MTQFSSQTVATKSLYNDIFSGVSITSMFDRPTGSSYRFPSHGVLCILWIYFYGHHGRITAGEIHADMGVGVNYWTRTGL